MLDHIGADVSDIERSRRFYAAALAPLGYAMTKDFGRATGFGVSAGPKASADPDGAFWIVRGEPPRQGGPRRLQRGADRAAVDAVHKAALAAGGRDNRGPGTRERCHPDYHAAFVLDPDGCNIAAVCHLPA